MAKAENGFARFERDMHAYADLAWGTPFALDHRSILACTEDFDAPAAKLDPHYFRQDIWAARRVIASGIGAAWHVDVGSRGDGFVAHLLAANIRVRYIDARPIKLDMPGFESVVDDARALASLEPFSVDSLSCLHCAEHIGLGRFGDEVSAHGWRKAITALARVLASGGSLYFAVPIGRERCVFNAHRVFAPATIVRAFQEEGLKLVAFDAITDEGALIEEPGYLQFASANYACGLFEWSKP